MVGLDTREPEQVEKAEANGRGRRFLRKVMQENRGYAAIGFPPLRQAQGRDERKSSRFPLFHLFHFLFYMLDLNAILADIEPQVRVNTHVLVGDPDEREEGDQVAAPVVEQQLVMGEDEEKGRHVMAEAEFAGKEEEKLAAGRVGMALTLADTIFARLAEDLFMRHGPGNAGDGKRERKKPYELQGERHS